MTKIPCPPGTGKDNGKPNAAYRQGQFAEAEGSYRRILERGHENGPLYYNLGNTCFKQKKPGEAIYCWEKARRLRPSDGPVRENLALANRLVVDRIDTPEAPYPVRFLRGIRDRLAVPAGPWLFAGLFAFANLLFLLYISLGNPRYASRVLSGSLLAGALALLAAGSLAWSIYERERVPSGIVLEQRVDVLSGPGADSITVCTLHEGLKVRIQAWSNGWRQVLLSNGWSGWIPQDAVGIL